MNVDALADRTSAEVQSDGRLGSAAIELVYAIFGEEVQRFPVLRPPAGWTEDAIHESAHGFFVKKVEALTAELTAVGLTGEITGRIVRKWIRNWLVSKARKTPLGRIRRKLEEDVLPVRPEFVRVPDGLPGAGRWYLAGQPSYPYGGEIRLLVRAAYDVDGVRSVRWSGPRRAPMASDTDLRRVVATVLETAAGSLEVAQLTHVLAQRFPAAAEPEDCLLDDDTFASLSAAGAEPDTAVETSLAVLDVFDHLSASQRGLLPLLPVDDVTTVMSLLGCGRSQAYDAVKRLKELLDRLLPADETRAAVLAGVVVRCST